MTDYSKKDAIRVLESFGYKYHGFNDIGWGEKFYVFELPESKQIGGESYVTYKLGEMRRRAYLVDMNHWMELQRQDEAMA